MGQGNFHLGFVWVLFNWNSLAQFIYGDMMQEGATRFFELSGKTRGMANRKYSENCAIFWVAHNAMLHS
jgi:hypothetical protein